MKANSMTTVSPAIGAREAVADLSPSRQSSGNGVLGTAPRLRPWNWLLGREGVGLTRAGLYYTLILLVVAAVGVARQINLMLILAGMLLGPLFYNWRQARMMTRSLRIRRLLPGGVCAGDLVVVRLEVTNLSRRQSACSIRFVDRIVRVRPANEGLKSEIALVLPYLGPGQTTFVSYEGRFDKRGRYRLGPLTMVTRFPFGLVERRVILPVEDYVVVCPRLGKLTSRWRALRRDPFESVPQRSQRETRHGEEFFGVREWQRGDSLRWIHWRRSARHQTWVVRQFECPKNKDLALIVDLSTRTQTPEEAEQIEHVIRVAATVLAEVTREGGNNVFLGLAAKESFWIAGPASASLLRVCLESLAEAEPTSPVNLSRLWAEWQKEIRPGCEIWVLTCHAEQVQQALAGSGGPPSGPARALTTRILQIPGPLVDEIFTESEAITRI